jgi:hypothetical protein
MITPFPLPLPSGIVVDLAAATDLAPLSGPVRHRGNISPLQAWFPVVLRQPGQAKALSVVVVGMVGGAEPCAFQVQTLDGEQTVRAASGEIYALRSRASELHPRQLRELWITLRSLGLVETR